MSTAAPLAHHSAGPSRAAHAVLDEHRAKRFFWTVLILATCGSVAGNVTHAVLNAPAGTVIVAAAAALVPPMVLLGATHSVALLVRTRGDTGLAYWCALAMMLALALCAFVLSFDALRALAITAGIEQRFAWLWPLAIDVSIAQATMALLSLTRRRRETAAVVTDDGDARGIDGGAHAAPKKRVARAVSRTPSAKKSADVRGGPEPVETLETVPRVALTNAVVPERDWAKFADLLIEHGVTSIEREKVAMVLAETAAKMPPTTIGRRWDVHHTTVKRIQAAASELAR
jgi:hypothetical protein